MGARTVVRQGLELIARASLVIAWLALATSHGHAQDHASAAKPEPIDHKPYAIRMLVDFELESRVDLARRETILDQWFDLVHRFVGVPWSPEVTAELGPLAAIAIDNLKAEDLKPFSDKVDKVWAIRVKSRGPALVMEGRELDVTTGSLGEAHRREVAHPSDFARELFRLTLALFTPLAEVGESKAGGVSFLVQAGSLPAASSMGEVAPVGSVFRALRIFPKPDGANPEIIQVKNSYFRVERREGPYARCEIIRGMGDPLTNRYARPNKLVALGIKPSSTPTRLRFLFNGDRQPAAGFRLLGRTIPPGPKPTELGMTDRDGRIVLPAGYSDGLLSLRLMAGNDEPMLEIPTMPGETTEERTITFDPRPLTLALEARLDALRDAIFDVVAVRSRLLNRMKSRYEGEDWAGLDATLKEFRALMPRDQFESRLTRIREEGERQELEGKTLVLTRNARNQIDETKGLIDRYLDDDLIRSYQDAAERAKAELADSKTPAKKGK